VVGLLLGLLPFVLVLFVIYACSSRWLRPPWPEILLAAAVIVILAAVAADTLRVVSE